MFFPDRSLSREILFPSTNFLSAQSPFEDGIREVSFFLPRFVPIKHVLSERARVKPARVPARKDSSTRKNWSPARERERNCVCGRAARVLHGNALRQSLAEKGRKGAGAPREGGGGERGWGIP